MKRKTKVFSSVSRRDFVLSATAMMACASCSHLDRFFGMDSSRDNYDVLIVGAGLAGLAAAYELKRRKISYRVVEASPRFGGRVQTLENFNGEGQFAELGAEFVDGRHQAMFDLCSDLNLTLQRLDRGDGDSGPAFFYRGKWVPSKDLVRETQPILSKLVGQRLRLTGDENDAERAFRRRSSPLLSELDQMSFSALLGRVAPDASPRALEFFKTAARGQFGVEAENQSCLHFLASLDPEIRRPGRYRIEGGSHALTRVLYRRVSGVIPDFIVKFGVRLSAIQRSERGLRCQLTSENGSLRWTDVKAVILAAPPSGLRRVDGIGKIGLNPDAVEAIQKWRLGSHSRTVAGWAEKFWTGNEGLPPASSWVGDFSRQSFWDSGVEQKGRGGLLTFSTAGRAGLETGVDSIAALQKDLQDIMGKKSPEVAVSQLRNWSRIRDIEGSVTVFEPGRFSQWNGIFQDIPEEAPLAFAGEHVAALHSGTMQAAVATGLRAARKIESYLRRPV